MDRDVARLLRRARAPDRHNRIVRCDFLYDRAAHERNWHPDGTRSAATWRTTPRRCAPSAIRMPISFVRCTIVKEITPYNPIVAIRSASAPKKPSNVAIHSAQPNESWICVRSSSNLMLISGFPPTIAPFTESTRLAMSPRDRIKRTGMVNTQGGAAWLTLACARAKYIMDGIGQYISL